MKLFHSHSRKVDAGHALVFVLVILAAAMIILGAVMRWSAGNARLIDRNNEYMASLAAAEAATEKVITEVAADYQKQGAAYVSGKVATYRSRVPTPGEHPAWRDYRFSNGQGTDGASYVQQVSPWAISPLISQYQGLSGFASTFRVVSNARRVTGGQGAIGAVRQQFQIATIPIFQFAIFYNVDLEINPGPNMTVNGRVHSNRDLFAQPQATLTFGGDVTSAGTIYHDKKPGDPTSRPVGTIVYRGEHDSGVNTLNLPIGVDNTPENVRQIVEVPPSAESPSGDMGRQRMYNQADLIIQVYDNKVEATGGVAAGKTPTLGWSGISSFVNTNVSFFNKREGKTVKTTQIDVGAFASWNAAGNPLRTALGRDINSIYVADLRSQTISTEPGVRLVNGQTLPPRGLTVATPDPLYVKGNYNVPNSALNSSDTSQTRPAALISDAITVLSGSWNDANAGKGLDSRVAAETTVNAAFLAGIVPTVNGSYSGGVENFPRFLEDWNNKRFTYNGSMIIMFPSQYATGTWKGTGSTIGIYNPPTRNWSFDLNFLDPSRLPPCTPEVRTVIRGQWAIVAPNTVGG